VNRLQVYESAALSIVEQADYYLEKSGENLASRWAASIDEAIGSILKWPEIGAQCRFRSELLAGMRWISIPGFPKHMIFYRYNSLEHTVSVIQVLHSARDIQSIFGDEEDTK
jgi:plasmid stabilization system protein ParE